MRISRRIPTKQTLANPKDKASFDLLTNGSYGYCRKCQQVKQSDLFFSAVNVDIDKNGRMSICKDCISEILNNNYTTTNHNIFIAMLNTCKTVDVLFSQVVVEQTMADRRVDLGKGLPNTFFGIYKGKLSTTSLKNGISGGSLGNMTFIDPGVETRVILNDNSEIKHDVKEFWGESYAPKDYEFLEREYSEWFRRHDVRTKEQELLFKYICQLQLDYNQKRARGESVSAILKDIQKAMDMVGASPNRIKESSTDNSVNTFSAFIKKIEETEPAEYYKDKTLFSDVDNIAQYCEDYITRPLLNFLGQTPPSFYVKDDGEGGHGGDLLAELQEDDSDSLLNGG